MTLRLLVIYMLVAFASSALQGAGRKADPPEPGVARSLARFRAEHYSNVRYALQIELTPGATLLKGTAEIRVDLDGAADQLVLDWRTTSAKQGQPQARAWDIKVNGAQAPNARQENEHIIIPGAYLKQGENVLRLRFESPVSTSGSAVTRYLDREDKSEYIYTLFVPSDASTVFPCFDQPDLKARFTLKVTAPQNWKVISH